MDIANGDPVAGLARVFSNRGERLGDGVGTTAGVAGLWSGIDCDGLTTFVEGALVV